MRHLAWGYRDRTGHFHEVNSGALRSAGYPKPPFGLSLADGREVRVIEIVLTCAHLDHQPGNCDPDNLRAWCQACHLAYDARHHAATAAARRRAEMATPDLLE